MAKPKAVPLQNRRRSFSDPLTAALQPPPDETLEEREKRLDAEYKAKKVSDGIDDMIRMERNQKKRARGEVKVLLLGQSESGKSTTLKQFQLMHTPAAFHAERIAWRMVIYLNLVRSIRRILDAISPEVEPIDDHDDGDSTETAHIIISSNGRPQSALSATRVPKYEIHQRRLEPLAELEERLTHLLSSPDEDEPTHLGPAPGSRPTYYNGNGNGNMAKDSRGRPLPTVYIPQQPPQSHRSLPSPVSPVTASTSSSQSLQSSVSPNGSNTTNSSANSKKKEVAVHTSTNWKKAFALGVKSRSPKSAHTGEIAGWWEDPEDPVHVLNACASAMFDLWRDPAVKKRLHQKRLRLQESSGFYLDEISRITAKMYIPTDEDVLKARLKTVGVVEHKFTIRDGSHRGIDWRIYDVGGARNQRQAWAPYFEDVNAIIFLAPISVFDQVLAEDSRVNRVEDSLLLWKSLIENKLLSNVNIILFLNKCDLLKAKLDAGVRLNHHMPSYGDRGNDYESVSKYFRNKFGALHQSYTPNKERQLFIHLTAVTDTRKTATIISNVGDLIIRGNLKNLNFV